MPFVLERVLLDHRWAIGSAGIGESLLRFGRESGLFTNLSVRKLGDKPEDPFQLLVSTGGREANLIDVGYGVSQALPIIVECVLARPDTFVLMQQPEVHLHPRAQAALGTFFADLVSNAGKQLVVETHSDYLIDRVRQEVAGGRIAAKDVAILFFERIDSETTVHTLTLDRMGNIIDAPASYRTFFLEEELRLLHR